jgi:hypothetical protein
MCGLSRLRVLPHCAALLVYGLFSIPCHAQEAKDRPAFMDQKLQMTLTGVSMSEALEAVSKAAHISVVADGEPILKKADFKFDGTIHDAIDSMARAFDYSWTATRAGVVIMSKQFSEPSERPQVNLPEDEAAYWELKGHRGVSQHPGPPAPLRGRSRGSAGFPEGSTSAL